MKLAILDFLIVLRLLTNDGIMLENRRPIPKRQPPEVIRFVRRPAKRGRKKFRMINEQETLQADNDPLFKKIADRLKKEIDYPDKPSKNGVPNEAPPEMINGYHPKFGKRKDYYKKLDPVSARSMPKTGDLEIDSQIDAAKNKPK